MSTPSAPELSEIRNFVALDDRLATAGQPTEQQLAVVRASGFEAVVNLGLLDPRYCLTDEARIVAALGMSYRHIPVDFQHPTLDDFRAFVDTMREHAGRRVFVHCAANFRVSCFVALYGERELGWSREAADAHVRKLWQPNEVWQAFLRDVRSSPAREK